MFVNTVSNIIDTSTFSKEEDIIKKSGILDRRRYIHIFYDDKFPQNSCKVIQINISTSKGSNILFDKFFMNRYNGTLSFIGVYVYDCELSVCDNIKDKFLHGKLNILTARRMDRETDYDNDVTKNEFVQLFSRLFNHYQLSDYVDSRVLVNPKFYTQEHEYYETGDFNPNGLMDDIYFPNLVGRDVVDSCTKIYQQHPSMFKTIKDTLLISDNDCMFNTDPKVLHLSKASDVISNMNYTLGCDNLINGGIFVYDSQMGLNFKDPSILNKKYITKSDACNELETFILGLTSIGKLVEAEFGSIRLFYNPSLIGSKCRIIYKDMCNQTSDHNLNTSKASKDSSHEVTEVIGEILEEGNGLFVHDQIHEDLEYGQFEKEKIISYF